MVGTSKKIVSFCFVKPRPEEYSFHSEEASGSMFNQWVPLKEAIEHCKPMTVVNTRVKVIDVGETG